MAKIVEVFLGTFIVLCFLCTIFIVFNFLIDTPRQLKRIADYLEKEKRNEKP